MKDAKEKRRVSLGEGLAALAKICLPILLFWGFVHYGGKLNEFDDRRSGVYSWMRSAYVDSQRQAYNIVKHLYVEYPITAIVKDDRDIPEGRIEQIPFNDQQMLVHPYSRGTRFIYEFLKNMVDNEASLFNAQFGRVPTADELYAILEEIPYWGYLLSVQDCLLELEWRQRKASHPNNFTGWDMEELEKFSQAFQPIEERMKDLLAKNPSTMKIMQIQLVSPSQDI